MIARDYSCRNAFLKEEKSLSLPIKFPIDFLVSYWSKTAQLPQEDKKAFSFLQLSSIADMFVHGITILLWYFQDKDHFSDIDKSRISTKKKIEQAFKDFLERYNFF